MNKILLAVLSGVTFFMSSATQAEESYFKLGIGQSKYDGSVAEKNEMATALAYGIAFDKYFYAELGYINFGTLKESGDGSSFSLQREAFYLAGIRSLPVTHELSVFGKLGLAVNRSEQNISEFLYDAAESTTKTKPMVGVGATYQLKKEMVGVVEYHYFGKFNDIKASALTFGLKYGFQ